MGYWNDVGEVLKRGVTLAVSEIKEGAETLVDKGREELSHMQIRRELAKEHEKLGRILQDIGDLCHEFYHQKKDIYGNDKFKKLIGEADAHEKICKELEGKLANQKAA